MLRWNSPWLIGTLGAACVLGSAWREAAVDASLRDGRIRRLAVWAQGRETEKQSSEKQSVSAGTSCAQYDGSEAKQTNAMRMRLERCAGKGAVNPLQTEKQLGPVQWRL
jgi:hypothetical protein